MSLRDGERALDVHGGQLRNQVLEHEGERHPRDGATRLAHPAHDLPLAVCTCTHMTTGHTQKPQGQICTNPLPRPLSPYWTNQKQFYSLIATSASFMFLRIRACVCLDWSHASPSPAQS